MCELPESEKHPKLLGIANEFLQMYPQMPFEELVLRCLGRSASEVTSADFESFQQVYQKHRTSLTKIAGLESNKFLVDITGIGDSSGDGESDSSERDEEILKAEWSQPRTYE